jgi:hypothetical protein
MIRFQYLNITVLILIFCHPLYLKALSVTDSLIFKNDNIIVGEIKSMDRGVIIMETGYSDKDFNIEWDEIKLIFTDTKFLITLEDGRKYHGSISSINSVDVNILTVTGLFVECRLAEIVFLSPVKQTFFDRFYASIDLSYSLTKAENLNQWSSRSTIGYRTELWNTTMQFNTFRSTQEQVQPINRSDGKIDFLYILPARLYAISTVSIESNSETKLDVRLNARLGFGRFFIRTNSAYWGIKFGLNRNVERFTNETPDRNSWEGYLGTELNLYDIGDFSLLSNITLYPGITARERLRGDFNLDTKYDLPLNFYIKISLSMNYDNKPAQEASEIDYVFLTGFGWEW